MDYAERRGRALKALSLSRRHHLPLTESARRVGFAPDDVLEYVGEAFEQVGDDWRATKRDQLPRELGVLTEAGPEWILTHDSRLASRLGQHDNAVRHYLYAGDPSRLKPLTVRVGDRVIRLASDPQTIDRLAEGGEIHFEVYRR
jgi:hypothetical protein